ncbi:MAG: response regulator transcription factor [Cyanobacteria bacterium CRU_2_1]|nr:response regulator transcription factor [Cyanobacteria bacterium CRU_2_1]
MTQKVLLIDDDTSICHLVCLHLNKLGYKVMEASRGIEGLQLWSEIQPDLILLDIMIPDMSGWAICQKVREFSNIPIIMLTARDEDIDKARGLDLGADDYLTKPFSFIELEARIRAVLRRTQPVTSQPKGGIYCFADLQIDTIAHTVKRAGKLLKLTPIEFKLLLVLVAKAGQLVSHNHLLVGVWGSDYANEVAYLKPYISRLRQKLGDDRDAPQFIETVYGFGYRFCGDTVQGRSRDFEHLSPPVIS